MDNWKQLQNPEREIVDEEDIFFMKWGVRKSEIKLLSEEINEMLNRVATLKVGTFSNKFDCIAS